MASILDRYGIREVADVTFYKLNTAGKPTNPVLYLDTLKVSTIEQTAEESEARGGKGNAPLIIWDYGKDINVTLEDALFSAKSMAMMFGNGQVQAYTGENAMIMKTETFIAYKGEAASASLPVAGTSSMGWKHQYIAPDGKAYTKTNPKFYTEEGENITSTNVATEMADGKVIFCTYDLVVTGSVITISADTFPGTYYITGDTYARNEKSGEDEFFQFIIQKAKVQSENTITLEAEGDPSVFNMNLRVMRPADGKMMYLVRYNLTDGTSVTDESLELIHNHTLTPEGEVAAG